MSGADNRHEDRGIGGGRRREAAALILRASHRQQMARHARDAYPGECCGVLLGTRREGAVWVSSVHAADNRCADAERDRYEIDPRAILGLDHAAAEQGQAVVGFYHSHPDHPPRPSAADAAQAWPEYMYVIMAVAAGEDTELTAWVFDEERKVFTEHPIRVRA
jgi:proteasome lid subunit RPN8/RPN11